MIEIDIKPKQLYEGCIQAAIAHAVAVGMYPELNYEHSWDGINYCMNDSQGCRATITFHNEYIVAVFQDIHKADWNTDALKYFSGAPQKIIQLAKDEVLDYLLDSYFCAIEVTMTKREKEASEALKNKGRKRKWD